ncbi:MAG: MCE family protein [Saprospiraceae bacterium]|nr:MCE family protein [Saprospiraceae bacterium]
MEKSTFQKLKLGAFVLSGVFLFLIATYYIGDQQSMFGNNIELYATFGNINGLKEGNNVRFSGINIGTVKKIQMHNDTLIVVKMALDDNFAQHIKKDAKAIITSDGLVGNMIINIIPGVQSQEKIKRNDTIYSNSRIRTDEMLNTLSITNENAALLTEELLKITREISHGQGILGALISNKEMGNDLKLTIENLRIASGESATAIKNLNQFVTSFDNKNNVIGTIKDTAIAKQLKNIVTNLENSTITFEKTINSLNATIGNANDVIVNIKEGDGLISYLSNDASLVKTIDRASLNLDSSIMQINAAGIRLNENLEALKHNWLLRGYFNKLEKQKEKKDQNQKNKE